MVHGYGRCFAFVGRRMAIVFCNQPPFRQPATTAAPWWDSCLEWVSAGSAVLLSTVIGRGTAAPASAHVMNQVKFRGEKTPAPFMPPLGYFTIGRCRLQHVACRTERTELTPSRLFSPARRNCCREAEGGSAIHLFRQSPSEAPVKVLAVGGGHLFLPPRQRMCPAWLCNRVCS